MDDRNESAQHGGQLIFNGFIGSKRHIATLARGASTIDGGSGIELRFKCDGVWMVRRKSVDRS